MAEGETQYNIPVSSKQLIVYFVFLVIALSAAFLAGVMVGRNVDSSPEPTVRDIQDAVPDEAAASPTPDALTYGSALQGDKVEGLASGSPPPSASRRPVEPVKASPTPAAPAASRPTSTPATARATSTPAASRPTPTPTPVASASPRPRATPSPTPSSRTSPRATPKPTPRNSATPKATATPISRLTIQVGAFKERAAAEAIVRRLKGKGYSAYLVPVSEGLFNVRVGSFTDREDAERILAKLETQEKFKPFIVKP